MMGLIRNTFHSISLRIIDEENLCTRHYAAQRHSSLNTLTTLIIRSTGHITHLGTPSTVQQATTHLTIILSIKITGHFPRHNTGHTSHSTYIFTTLKQILLHFTTLGKLNRPHYAAQQHTSTQNKGYIPQIERALFSN